MARRFKYGLSDDAPKSTRSEDQLGHAAFAERVASVIATVDAPNGYVLGLHGAWGSGKSTTLNFIVECIDEHNGVDPENQVVHVDFRPWLITGHQDLIGAFLKVLSEKVSSRKSRRRRRFRKGAQWANETNAVGSIIKVGTAWTDVSGGLGSSVAGNIVSKSLRPLLSRLSATPSLQAAHEEMTDRLRELNTRLLVTVDDIDRLDTSEIRCVMQMVKSVGRLPNVVYLLCYDRAIVRRALGEPTGPARPSFAEKIVQQELELPVPHRSQLLKLLDKETEFLVGGTEQTARWEHIVRDGARRWIRTPRDVVRLANALKFSWSALEGEIDPQDLFAMEGIRLFDPEVFEWIRENRSLLFAEGRFLVASEGDRKAALDRLKQAIPDRVQAEVLDLVAALFPQLSEALLETPQAWTEERADWVTRRGVGSEAGYDAYFGLGPSSDAVPLHELLVLISTADASAVEESLRRYLHRTSRVGTPIIGDLLEEIYLRYHGQHAAKPTQAMLDALLAVGEELIRSDLQSSGIFDANPRAELHLIIGRMLDIWGAEEGGKRLIEAFLKAHSPALLADIFEARGVELGVFESSSSRNDPRVSEADFEELGGILRGKIRLAERDGTLSDAPFFFGIVRTWKHLCGPSDPRRWLEDGMKSDSAFMVTACRGLVSRTIGTKKPEYHMREVPDPDLYNLSLLHEAARKHLADSNLTSDEHRLVATVLEASARMLER